MTKDLFIYILGFLCVPLEIIWKVLCIVPAVVALPVCVWLDHVEHKRGNKGYAVTGMAGFMARSLALPTRIFFWIFGIKDVRLERTFEEIRDFEEKGL